MNHRNPISAVLLMVFSFLTFKFADSAAPESGDLFLTTQFVKGRDDTPMVAEFGYFYVPENRNRADSKLIAIAVMRFLSTASDPKEPVFVMAGGPGSSYISSIKNSGGATRSYQMLPDLIEDLRKVGDVIIPDQRGAGLSMPILSGAPREASGPLDQQLDRKSQIERMERYAHASKQKWIEQGHDLDGYHPQQLAKDIDQLRQELGYEKISLYGGSFGSQSSFTLLRMYPQNISRVLLWGIEDINDTFDMPSGILDSLEQVIKDAELDPDLSPHVPEGGILAAVKKTIELLAADPVTVSVKHPRTREQTDVVIGPEEFKMVWHTRSSRDGKRSWPGSLLPVFEGDFSGIARQVAAMKTRTSGGMNDTNALLFSMDCGLMPSEAKSRRLEDDPAIEILGDINLSYNTICGCWGAPDVDEDFKAAIQSNIPALFLHGTCDTSTPLMNALSVVRGYPNGHLVVVERATHDIAKELYDERPEFIRPLLVKFLRGESIDGTPKRISLPPADYTGPK